MNKHSPTTTARAALYLRVSTARQAEHDISIPDQKRQGEAYCEQRGLQLVETFIEAGATATNDGSFETQSWGPHGRLETSHYAVERVAYQSKGTEVVGNLFTPAIPGRKPAVVIIGPVGFVKEQSPVQYASRLMREGYAALIFDPRYHGESGGEPRRHENGVAKVEDLRASVDFLATREHAHSVDLG